MSRASSGRVVRRKGLRVVGPQFNRPTNAPPVQPAPSTIEAWDALRTKTKAQLVAMGLQSWDGALMLFPAEWYSEIPQGFLVETINGQSEAFEPGKTDDDRRFGALAYGVRHAGASS